MPNNFDDLTTRTRLRIDLVIVGHVLIRHHIPAGAVVTPFPDIDIHHCTGTPYRPVALVLSYQGLSVPVASPDELLQASEASRTKFHGSLVPVWFHRPRSRLVLAPHHWAPGEEDSAPIPAGVRAHLLQAPDAITEIYHPTVI
ncbi:hypothetical protein [Nocardia ignorata]|uniref:Uncharacterized protein n=1 Tax=Nocardia ignorata TaxID=145285 RepID=A0A4R6NX19_NOCIG|nr:hypothetical protein [Nocardia ignorata]TDP28395.1 hypothetical protein DFR75_1178 [Nocardia ignorata]